MPLTKDRVVYDSAYLHKGKEIVLFHNPLTLEEWEEILENQKKAAKLAEAELVIKELTEKLDKIKGEKNVSKKESKSQGKSKD